jgi:hypothetical protein
MNYSWTLRRATSEQAGHFMVFVRSRSVVMLGPPHRTLVFLARHLGANALDYFGAVGRPLGPLLYPRPHVWRHVDDHGGEPALLPRHRCEIPVCWISARHNVTPIAGGHKQLEIIDNPIFDAERDLKRMLQSASEAF